MCIDCVGGHRNDGEALVMRADDIEAIRSAMSDEEFDAEEDRVYRRLSNSRTIARLLFARGIPAPDSLAFVVE